MEANGQICFVCTKLFHPGDTYHTFRTIGGAALHLHGSCTEHLVKEAERIVRERKAHMEFLKKYVEGVQNESPSE